MPSANSWTSSGLLYEYVASDVEADPRLVRSLERIRIVCDEIADEALAQARRGAQFPRSPIYLTEVGRRCRVKFGGPSAESIIRNRASEPIKAAYIELRARELDLPGQRPSTQAASSMIEDVRIRAYVQSLEQRLKISEEMVVGLTATLRDIRPISLSTALACAGEDDQLEVARGIGGMPSQERISSIVRLLTDPVHLGQFGLRSDIGIYNPATGVELLSQEDVQVLKAVAGLGPSAQGEAEADREDQTTD